MNKPLSIGRCESCGEFYRVKVPFHGSGDRGTRTSSPVKCSKCGGNVRRSTRSAYQRAMLAARAQEPQP